MARVVTLEQAQTLKGQMRHWAYNALDAMGTREVWESLHPRLTEPTARIYAFERAIQGPAMTMSRRGVLVDTEARKDAVKALEKEKRDITKRINALPEVKGVWDGTEKVTGGCKHSTRKDGKHVWEKGVADNAGRKCTCCGMSRFVPAPINPGSPIAVMRLLYTLHEIPKHKNKAKKVSVDDDVLDKIGAKYPAVAALCKELQAYRATSKQIGFLNGVLTPDNRYKSSFNVGAAWTGRFSSSKYVGHYGGNLQNIAEKNRYIFTADPGMELCYMDLKKAESHVVSYLSGDEAYIEAHEGPYDTHTFVTRLCWPDLDWTGDPKADKALATKTNPPWDDAPGHDWRFQGKRIAHAKNIGQTPQGTANVAHIPVKVAKEMHRRHREAFPFIAQYQHHVRASVQAQDYQINPLGRRCKLFGRPWDDSTWRQALAFRQQSPVADVISIALWRVWYNLDPHSVQLLAQVHDALLFQFPKGEYEHVKRVADLMRIPMEVVDYRGNKRTLTIGVDAAVGLNWGKRYTQEDADKAIARGEKPKELNPNGIKEIEI